MKPGDYVPADPVPTVNANGQVLSGVVHLSQVIRVGAWDDPDMRLVPWMPICGGARGLRTYRRSDKDVECGNCLYIAKRRGIDW